MDGYRGCGSDPHTWTVHEDGKVTASRPLGYPDYDQPQAPYRPMGEPNHCMSAMVEESLAETVDLIRRVAQQLEVHGGYTLRVGLASKSTDPIYIRTTEGGTNFMLSLDSATAIHDFQAITEDFDPLEAVDDLLPFVRNVCLDLINQGGVRFLKVLRAMPATGVTR